VDLRENKIYVVMGNNDKAETDNLFCQVKRSGTFVCCSGISSTLKTDPHLRQPYDTNSLLCDEGVC
jgi:hypothetical protein